MKVLIMDELSNLNPPMCLWCVCGVFVVCVCVCVCVFRKDQVKITVGSSNLFLNLNTYVIFAGNLSKVWNHLGHSNCSYFKNTGAHGELTIYVAMYLLIGQRRINNPRRLGSSGDNV